MHKEIVCLLDADIAKLYAAAIPEGLLGMRELATLDMDVVHTTEHLRCIDLTILHPTATSIPEATACRLGEIGIGDMEAIGFPKDIFTLEATVISLDIARLLDRRLAHMDGDILKA